MMRRRFATIALMLLAGCAPADLPPARMSPPLTPLPAMNTFAGAPAVPPTRPNPEMVRDFLELTFRMESGRALPVLTRFEEPIRVAVRGDMPPTAAADLERLLARLRREAGLDIARAPARTRGNLTLEFLPRRAIQGAVPQAACFVIPRDETFARFRRSRRSGASEWASLPRREAATVFIPSDVAPQEIRDCLHEEIAQAIGPLNDLYRLPDSVFNDDNFHTVLTGFDMLVLRATYAPELASGMSEAEVARRLPALFARLNPRGQRAAGPPALEDRAWIDATEAALSPRSLPAERRAAAGRALTIAQDRGWTDPRLAFSYFALGRSALAREANLALAAYVRAGELYRDAGLRIHEAHVGMQMAAFALSSGHPEAAIAIADRHAPVALRAENAALLATLLLLKAEALDALGRRREAAPVRLDSLGWARYGFGSDGEVRARVREISALRPGQFGGGEGS